jgi:hypothetical protein|tara:strand:- start:6195 stop:6383 length:189 start_codon:yes stop_codon:yes gene_type:complete
MYTVSDIFCSRLIVGGVDVLFDIAATIEPLLRGFVATVAGMTFFSRLIVGGAGVLFKHQGDN